MESVAPQILVLRPPWMVEVLAGEVSKRRRHSIYPCMSETQERFSVHALGSVTFAAFELVQRLPRQKRMLCAYHHVRADFFFQSAAR
jgi:hypothetical protein